MLAHQRRGGSHSSRPWIAPWLQQPTRASRSETLLPVTARGPYLALLRVGFAMRTLLPMSRCALAAPFHPCLCALDAIGGILSVALSLGSGPKTSPGGRYPPPLFRGARTFLGCEHPRLPDPLAILYLASPRSRSKSNWNRIARTCPSISPSIFSGRQRRWKASTALCPSVIS